MIGPFSKAIGQLSDPAFKRVIRRGFLAALLVFVLLWAAVWGVLSSTQFFQTTWIDVSTDLLGGLATLVLTWLLFPVVVTLIIGFYLDAVAEAVERRHYPNLPPAREPPLLETVAATVRFAAVAVLLNLLALAVYGVLIVLPGLNLAVPLLFYGLNGYLLSREYFELVAARRLDSQTARATRRAHQGYLFGIGVATAFLLTIPIVNLIVPVIGTAAMVHAFQSLRAGRTRV